MLLLQDVGTTKGTHLSRFRSLNQRIVGSCHVCFVEWLRNNEFTTSFDITQGTNNDAPAPVSGRGVRMSVPYLNSVISVRYDAVKDQYVNTAHQQILICGVREMSSWASADSIPVHLAVFRYIVTDRQFWIIMLLVVAKVTHSPRNLLIWRT